MAAAAPIAAIIAAEGAISAAAVLAPYATTFTATVGPSLIAGVSTAAAGVGAFLANDFVSGTLGSIAVNKAYAGAKKGIIKGLKSPYKPLRAISRRSVGVYRRANTSFSKSALGYIGAGAIKGVGKGMGF